MRQIAIVKVLFSSTGPALDMRRTVLASALLGGIIALALLGASRAAIAQQPSELTALPLKTRVLSCQDVTVLSPSDCAHFNDLARDFDRVAETTQRDLEFLQDLQLAIGNSTAYQEGSQDELGDAADVRLQMYLDSRSKYLEMLSNVMKKASDTEQALASNGKPD
jgi:hypothetical protein